MNPFRRRLLVVLGAVIASALLFPVLKAVWSRLALNRFVAHLEAQGERVSEGSLPAPTLPASARQATLEIANRLYQLPPLGNRNDLPFPMRPRGPGLAVPASTDDRIDGEAIGPERWNALARVVAERSKAVDEVRGFLDQAEAIHFGIALGRGADFTQPELLQVRDLARTLLFSGVLHLHNHDAEGAGRDLSMLLLMVNRMRDERAVAWQLTRLSISSMAVSLSWDLLESDQLTEPQLHLLQMAWGAVDFLTSAEAAIAQERLRHRTLFREARSDAGRRRQLFQPSQSFPTRSVPAWTGGGVTLSGIAEQMSATLERSGELTRLWTVETLWKVLYSYEDEHHTLDVSQRSLDAIRSVQRGRSLGVSLRGVDLRGTRRGGSEEVAPISRALSSQLFSAPRLVERSLLAVGQRELVVAATALHRFRARERRWPREWSELVPAFLSAPPRDPGDGQTLRYRLDLQGRPFLYSVGMDGLDQGGDGGALLGTSYGYALWRGLDLVWPRKATAEDIEKARKNGGAPSPVGAR
jgi:hypothetical protein